MFYDNYATLVMYRAWPHWSLVGLVSDFLNSFRPAAAMVSCSLQWRLVPVVEQLGRAHTQPAWKLDPVSLKFFLKVRETTVKTFCPLAILQFCDI